MRKYPILGIYFLLFFFSHVVYGQSALQGRLIFLEKQRFVAMTQKDTLFLQKTLADDLIYTHSNALVESKKDFLQSIQTGKIVYKTLDSEEINVRLFGKTAILNGIVHVVGALNGKEFDLRLRYTDVYCKHKKGWQLAAWQSVKVP